MEQLDHFSHEHPLAFSSEEQKIAGQAICCGCQEPVFGPTYNCSECNFVLHKSCAQLPTQTHHPLHRGHALVLRAKPSPEMYTSCDACSKICNGFIYRCHPCNFDLDIICASLWRNIMDDGHQHVFIPLMKQIHFTCEACGEEGKCISSLCSICQLWIHRECADCPRTLKIIGHDHLLKLIYSLHQIPHPNYVFCKLCYRKVNTKFAAYYCPDCNYIAHLYCATRTNIVDNSVANEAVDFVTRVTDHDINHFRMQHNLVLCDVELEDDKRCYGCVRLISPPFYSCSLCDLFLHKSCNELPGQKQHPLHQHPLTLRTNADSINSIFICDACGHHCNGFAYNCDQCHFNLDVHCSLISEKLTHRGHEHPLFLPRIKTSECCSACGGSEEDDLFVCLDCNFTLGYTCATLPFVAWHSGDDHLLSLMYASDYVEDDSRDYYCLICEEERNPHLWFYYCADCDFSAHPRCVLGDHPFIKFGATYKYDTHPHSLTFVQKTKNYPPCDACGEPCTDWSLSCAQCRINVHGEGICFWQQQEQGRITFSNTPC